MHARRDFLRTAALAAGWTATQALAAGIDSAAARPVKVGQICTGHAHASGKMDGLRKLSQHFDVVGVVEPDPQRRRIAEQSATYRGLRWMTEDELLATPGLQAVAVETTVADLVPTTRRCIAAGMQIHMDKPAGTSLEAYRQLLDAATAKGLHVQMGFMFRHNPAFRLCFEAVRQGWLGTIFEVHGGMGKKSPAAERGPMSAFTGGVMFELGCHIIDAVVRVLGAPRQVTSYSRSLRSDVDAMPDNQLAVLEYEKALATVRVCVEEVDGGPRRQFVVCGTEGTLEIRPLEPPKLMLTLSKPQGQFKKGRQEVQLPAMPGRYDEHLVEWANIIRGLKSPEYDPQHDLAVHAAVLKAAGM